MKIKKKFIVIIPILCVLVVGLSILSEQKFGTINFPYVASAIIKVNITDKKLVIVKNKEQILQQNSDNSFASPTKVIIATPQKSYDVFMDYIKKEGYIIIDDETFGSVVTIEKSGQKQKVEFKVNSYYSIWLWN